MKVAIIGGSGKLGMGFVARLGSTNHEVAVGSRNPEKGVANAEAAAWCDLAIVTVPYSAHQETLAPLSQQLNGKIVIDATVPLNPKDIFQVVTLSGRSAAEETRELLPGARVFAAFQTVSHRILQRTEHSEDVFVAGTEDGKAEVLQLVKEMNLHPVNVGPLEAAALLERMTVLLISINKANRVKECGLKVTGI